MDRFIKRELWPQLIDSLDHNRVVILLGPRRVGKTTLLKRLMDYLQQKGTVEKHIFYYNLDDVTLRTQVKKDFHYLQKDMEQQLGDSLKNQKDRIYLFLDEGQKAPDVFELVKIFYDEELPIKTFISGSSSLNIRNRAAETLGGRVDNLNLYPLTLSEAAELGQLSLYHYFEENITSGFLKKHASPGFRNKPDLDRIFNKMLFSGGLPEVYLADKQEGLSLLNNFINSYLDKDIQGMQTGLNLEKFQLSFRHLAEYTAELINYSQTSQDVGIKRETLSNYFELLEKTLVIQTLPPYTFPKLKNIFKSRKLFFFDSGVVNRLRGFMNLEEAKNARFLGHIFENLIFQNIYSRMMNDIKRPELYYLRDYQNHEIDFVYRRGQIVIPIEATFSQTISKRKLKKMAYFLKKIPNVKHALIFYCGEPRKFDVDKTKVFALPYFMV